MSVDENKKNLKIADIAALAGVSKSTVSFVLNGHAKKHRITEDTVKKVERIVKKYNYRPNRYALALKSKISSTVGIVIPDLCNIGFANVVKELERLYRDNNYQLLIASSEDNIELEKASVQSLLDRQVDLLIVASSMSDDSYYRDIHATTPVLFFDRNIQSDYISSVCSDQVQSTRQVVAKLAQGLSECVYIGGQFELSPSRDRLEGFKLGLCDAKLNFKPEHVFHKDYQSDSGYLLMSDVVSQFNGLPPALFTASYSLLEGVLRYLSEHKLLATDMKIATFDNYSILDCLPKSIDSIEQDCQLIAKTLFDKAGALMGNSAMPRLSIILPSKLHLRSKN
ncbi:LacI family DNA-binding transcriptional regulator [Alginatibacterium sediminis]|uniref:LacI family DNA-binding transcriptional regulator n=1 Tax=Alginatibacterium sediminis TaxID=2164068 RepID=A0A420EBD3_9ALTE|nr:LacI family DNA-binding transcriptional regulator [Alginatibacterium sediminis]RKF17964.1 LacI family DNA-binding transcriptional regulator [Alginatibacterium sediminis]